MKQNLIKLSALAIILLINMTSFAQYNSSDVNNLQEVLKKSIYFSEFTLSDDGTFTRNDSNGNTMIFNLNDIKTVSIIKDKNDKLLIKLEKGKKAEIMVNGTERESDKSVFAFKKSKDCKLALELFNKLIEQ